MKHAGIVVVIALGAFLSLSAHAQSPKRPAAGKPAATKKVYCWEEQGRRTCGDALPASAVGQARTEINARTGIVTKQVERSMTEEERLAQAQQQEQQKIQDQQQQEMNTRIGNLVSNYPTESALVAAYQEKIDTVQHNVKLSEMGLLELRRSLLSELQFLGDAELAGKALPKKRQENVVAWRKKMEEQKQTIARQQALVKAYEQERDVNIQLFRQAKSTATGL